MNNHYNPITRKKTNSPSAGASEEILKCLGANGSAIYLRQPHPHAIAIPLKAFTGKPSSGESNENPNRNLHVISSAESLRRESQERLGACPLQRTQRASASGGFVR
jgi:hypothetical protein